MAASSGLACCPLTPASQLELMLPLSVLIPKAEEFDGHCRSMEDGSSHKSSETHTAQDLMNQTKVAPNVELCLA